MATNFLKNIGDSRDDASSLFAGGLAAAPLVGAVAIGMRRLKSGMPVTVSEVLASQTNLADLGRSVGRGLKDGASLDKVTEKFMESDAFDEMMKKTQERNAVIASLLSTVDDPSAGFDPTKLQSLKDDLLRIADESTGSEDARKIMKAAISTINESGSEPLQRRFASRFKAFAEVGDQLVAPKFEFKSGAVFNMIEHGNMRNMSKDLQGQLFGKGADAGGRLSIFQNRYSKLMDMVGRTGNQSVEIVSAASGGGQQGIYARLFATGAGGSVPSSLLYP
jgi:hypothetical protein